MTIAINPNPFDKSQLAAMLRDIIDQFPEAMPNPLSEVQRVYPSVNEMIQQRLREWDLPIDKKVYNAKFNAGYHIAVNTYNHIRSPEMQVEIALYTGLMFVVDDGLVDPRAVEEFVPRLCSGSRQLHPVLDHFVETCHVLQKSYPTFGANSIYASTIDFVNAEHFQGQDEAQDLRLSGDSAPYVRYMRDKDGVGAAYAAFVWPKDRFPDSADYIQVFPDTIDCICFINDIFSYYKEVKAGDDGNYINRLAIANKRSEATELAALVAHVKAVFQRVRRILGEGKARDAWEHAIGGYIRFHLQAPRYQLSEILPELKA